MNFIAMLTHNDTEPNADKIHETLRACHHSGFRDVGAARDEPAVVAGKAHADGLDVLREVVSRSEQSELAFWRRLPDRSRVSNGRYAHGKRRAHAWRRPCQLLWVAWPCQEDESTEISGAKRVTSCPHIAGTARAPVGCSAPRLRQIDRLVVGETGWCPVMRSSESHPARALEQRASGAGSRLGLTSRLDRR